MTLEQCIFAVGLAVLALAGCWLLTAVMLDLLRRG